MSAKKSQHFVPRFYLKNFSNKKSCKTICLFNIDKEIFIPSASIKHQACLPYFYGTDGIVEDNLSKLEGVFANIISEIINLKEIPGQYSEKHFLLLLFIISMASRTEYSAEAMDETIDKTYKTIYKEDPRFKDYIQDFKIGIKNPATYYLGIALQCIPIIFDLEFKLLNNETNTAFLTSDNPVIKYSQFLELKKAFGGITGYGEKGIQLLIPISPNSYIIFYDPIVYKIGNRKQKVMPVNNSKDIDVLNLLQFINAHKTVFFNETINQNYVKTLFDRGKKYFRNQKSNVLDFPLYKDSDGNKRKIFLTYPEDIKINLSLSFIKLLKKAKKYELDNRAVHVRNKRVSEIYDLITEKFKTPSQDSIN